MKNLYLMCYEGVWMNDLAKEMANDDFLDHDKIACVDVGFVGEMVRWHKVDVQEIDAVMLMRCAPDKDVARMYIEWRGDPCSRSQQEEEDALAKIMHGKDAKALIRHAADKVVAKAFLELRGTKKRRDSKRRQRQRD